MRKPCSWTMAPPTMRVARLASVAAGPLILYGCAVHPVRVEPDLTRGHLTARPGRPGFVVTAPHGTSDVGTGEMVREIARRSGFGVVIASGFSLEPDSAARPGRRYQVNRPLEGVPGRSPAEEVATDGARRVYEAYTERVRAVAQGPLAFYAEVHGNNRPESADRIEIATVGIDREWAFRLRALFELIRDAYLRDRPKAWSLSVLVEPADALRYTAAGAKRDGILRLPQRALHVELPRIARTDAAPVYTAILSDFFIQASTLPLGR